MASTSAGSSWAANADSSTCRQGAVSVTITQICSGGMPSSRTSRSASAATWSATPRMPHASSSTTEPSGSGAGPASRRANSERSRCSSTGESAWSPGGSSTSS